MKKIISFLAILVLVFIAMTGCGKTVDEKLCRIEIADSNYNVITVLENNHSLMFLNSLMNLIGKKQKRQQIILLLSML